MRNYLQIFIFERWPVWNKNWMDSWLRRILALGILNDFKKFLNFNLLEQDWGAKIRAIIRKHIWANEINEMSDWFPNNYSQSDWSNICSDGNESTARITALTCIANANNEFYLGPGSLDEIGEQIALAKGCAGPNSDYLFRLVDAIRTLFPNYCDNHIFALEGSVMERRQRA